MTEQTVISFDPGLITGVAQGVFSEDEPLRVTGATVVTYDDLIDGFYHILADVPFDHVVAEKFVLRTNNEFAADLSGVRVEGILDVAYDRNIVWRNRTLKSQVSDGLLKYHGLWRTGKDVGWTDGRDANDAIIHMIGYVAFDLKHEPTLRRYFAPMNSKAKQ